MKIKITEANRGEIQTALDGVNGMARNHVAGCSAVFRLAELGEKELAVVAKARRKGAKAQYTSGGKCSNSYKYQRVVTSIAIERGVSDWYLTDAQQWIIWPTGKTGSKVELTHEQTMDVLRQYEERGVKLTLTPPVAVSLEAV